MTKKTLAVLTPEEMTPLEYLQSTPTGVVADAVDRQTFSEDGDFDTFLELTADDDD